MSAISAKPRRRRRAARGGAAQGLDPRVVRSRAAAVEAARALFLEKRYAGTTMEDIAALAGIAKRTLYNNYPDKAALFAQIVSDVIALAEQFARGVRDEFAGAAEPAEVRAALHDLGRRLALRIVRPEVIAIRRLLISEARAFPEFAKQYFDRAPGQVITALASVFDQLVSRRVLEATDTRRAAGQFAYLIAGEPLDRAVLVGTLPPKQHIVESAREGVETFLARYVPR